MIEIKTTKRWGLIDRRSGKIVWNGKLKPKLSNTFWVIKNLVVAKSKFIRLANLIIKIEINEEEKTESRERKNNKIALSKLGEKNPKWKGDKVGYSAIHDWVIRHIEKPDICSSCRKKGWLDLANKSQKYKRDLTDWEWLCRKCHMTKDGRLKKFKNMDRTFSKRKIIQLTLGGKKIKIWPSIKEAAKFINVCESGIIRAAQNGKWKSGGFLWKYL